MHMSQRTNGSILNREVFITIWLEVAATNNTYLVGFAVHGGAEFSVTIPSTWYACVTHRLRTESKTFTC